MIPARFRGGVGLCAGVLLIGGCSQSSPESVEPIGAPAPTAVAPESLPTIQVEEGFQALSLTDFEPFKGEAGTWREETGMLITSGNPKGYAHSQKSYRNFTWRLEYRFVPPVGASDAAELDKCNTGFMIHIQEPHKVWPRSLEVQGKQVEMCSIKSNGGAPDLVIQDDHAARESARKPVGEWNSVEIVSRDGTLSSTLNGVPICTSEAGELTEGRIGLQAELFEVQFRNMRIREDP